jgi:type I restriction enzyme M protein
VEGVSLIKNYNGILTMTSTQQRASLQHQIWAITNDICGAVDGWDFKQCVLGTLFCRPISDNFAVYMEGEES